MAFYVGVSIDDESLVNDLVREVGRQDLIDFIKKIDERMGDWDFTLELCRNFEQLKIEWEKEQAEDKAVLEDGS